MFTLIGICILIASWLIVVAGLPMVASDTLASIRSAAKNAKTGGAVIPQLSFLMLWALIFTLSISM